MNEKASNWVEFAQEDLQVAQLTYDAGIWNQACFHAQQCVEKLLKAIVANMGAEVPRIHRLADLLGLVSAETATALAYVRAEITTLDRFYIPTRYPDALPGTLPTGMPDERDAAAALATAKEVAEILQRLLN